MRQCVVRRELVPRDLLFRVIRGPGKEVIFVEGQQEEASEEEEEEDNEEEQGEKEMKKKGKGKKKIVNGRSAYIGKEAEVVGLGLRKKALNRSLRCDVPSHVTAALKKAAHEWSQLSNEDKGVMYCEVHGLSSWSLAVDAVQQPLSAHDSEVV